MFSLRRKSVCVYRLLTQLKNPGNWKSGQKSISITTASNILSRDIFTSGSLQQYRPHDNRGHGSGFWWDPVLTHQLV